MSNKYIKFFTRLIILVVCFFIVDFIIGQALNHYYFKQSSGYQYRLTYVIDNSNEEILAFGSSRANHHYVPNIFRDSLQLSFYNAGIDGQFILFESAILNCVLKRYTPKYIILDFNDDEFIYSESSYERLSDLLPYYSTHSNEIGKIVSLRGKYEKIKLLSRMYPYNSIMLTVAMGNLEMNKKRKEDFQGYVPLVGNIDYEITTSKIKNTKIDSNKVNAFKDIINKCKSLDINLFVVMSPYYESLEVDSKKLCSDICKEMNVPFWDYSTDAAYLRKKEFFKDVKHLNNSGAEMFSQELAKRIKILVKNEPPGNK